MWYFCFMNEMPAIFRFTELSELNAVSTELLKIGKDVPVWLFNGNMGAGKTTLIKSICNELGIKSLVQSPTFALVNEYLSESQQVVYHFDFYRIKDETEALDMGVEEYFDSGDYCFIEWPEKIQSLWPSHYLELKLSISDHGERILEVAEIGKYV
jgi:tRNA threonylcarbamoyladenosine biosynthesis protein TsaE